MSKLIRIGSDYGGYVIPENFITEKSICYLVGSGEDISFDLGLSKMYNPFIYVFDPTPRAEIFFKKNVIGNKKMFFFNFGFYKKDGEFKFYPPKLKEHCSYSAENIQQTEDFIMVNMRTYQTVMDTLNHKQVDLLKLDVEGSEHDILKNILPCKERLPKLLLIEFHEHLIDNSKIKSKFIALKNELLDDYNLLHIDNNNFTYLIKLK